MSITTYDTLKTAVARWLKRDDLTAYIPDYITFGEHRLWYGDEGQFPTKPVRLKMMQVPATGTISSGLIQYPTDGSLVEIERLSASSGGVTWPLTYLSPQQFAEYESKTGDPKYFTFRNFSILTAPVGSATYTMDYYAKPTALSGSNSTTQPLIYFPELYLFAACIEGALDMQNDQLAARFAARLQGRINAIQRVENHQQPGGSLCVQVGR